MSDKIYLIGDTMKRAKRLFMETGDRNIVFELIEREAKKETNWGYACGILVCMAISLIIIGLSTKAVEVAYLGGILVLMSVMCYYIDSLHATTTEKINIIFDKLHRKHRSKIDQNAASYKFENSEEGRALKSAQRMAEVENQAHKTRMEQQVLAQKQMANIQVSTFREIQNMRLEYERLREKMLAEQDRKEQGRLNKQAEFLNGQIERLMKTVEGV